MAGNDCFFEGALLLLGDKLIFLLKICCVAEKNISLQSFKNRITKKERCSHVLLIIIVTWECDGYLINSNFFMRRIVYILFFAFFAMNSFAQKTVVEFFNAGIAKYRAGAYKEAIVNFNKVLELNPKFYEAYGNMGNAKFRLGDYKGAKDDYDVVLKQNPKDALSFYNRAIAKKELGDLQGAIEDNTTAIKINPKFAEAFFNRGNTKDDMGDAKAAMVDYNKAISLNPSFAKAYYNRGHLKYKAGDVEAAALDWEKAASLDHYKALDSLKEYCGVGVQETPEEVANPKKATKASKPAKK